MKRKFLTFALIFLGAYLLSSPPANSGMDGSLARNRFVTPSKKDHKNDTFIFSCYNPQDLKVSGKIFDLRGRKIADMKVNDRVPSDYYTDIEWDPDQSDFGKAPSGLYVYQVIMGQKVYKGIVIVVR